MKPTLKKVSKYENKFAKLQKKAAEFNFRNQLKQVKKKEFTLEEEDKEVRMIVFDKIFASKRREPFCKNVFSLPVEGPLKRSLNLSKRKKVLRKYKLENFISTLQLFLFILTAFNSNFISLLFIQLHFIFVYYYPVAYISANLISTDKFIDS